MEARQVWANKRRIKERVVLMFLGNPSFVSGQGWMARKRKQRYGEGVVYSPILRFAGSPIRGLRVTAEGAELAEVLVSPWA